MSTAHAVTSSATSSTTPSTTQSALLRASPAVRAAFDTILQQLASASARLTDVRPPNPALAQSYQQAMGEAAKVRGKPLLYPYLGSGLGHGALVELADASVKWDMISGIGVHFFGHSDPEFARAGLEASLDDTLKHGNLQSNGEAYEFLRTLLDLAGRSSRLKHGFIATSGAMANENAIKLCYQKHSPASRVIVFNDCFMGRSTTMTQIGDAAEYRVGLPLNVLVDYFPFWDPVKASAMGGKARFIDGAVKQLEALVHRYPRQHACFVFEFVQGEGGFNAGDRDYFKALIEVCRANSIAVWDDEIQTFGRLTRMFAYEYFDLGEYVDVLCVGKMTQACATLWTEGYNPKGALISGTFTGEGVSFRAGTRVLERLRDGEFYGDKGLIARHHEAFRRECASLMARRPEWFPKTPEVESLCGGAGGMMRFTPFGGDKDKVQKAARGCFDEGAIVFYCGHGPYHVRMLPPLGVMKLEDWPRVFACVEKGLARAAV